MLVRVLDGAAADHKRIDNTCAIFDRMLERYKTIACMATGSWRMETFSLHMRARR
ncbi:hypothetical protein DB30_06937 [Enhygromyxa salina]|uniref:Uncharacterized protein n=1 Tax=Enhygromyxa salina TaxID=215803 RepID=A0A0C2CXH7_9BACT|nr:hypothetical protein [Enhygromyxa salina]KIG14335.1 hypothetical protein DB30_06937 [Enhygromyxa salina]